MYYERIQTPHQRAFMARPRTLDRDRLLDAAEEVIAAQGLAALSFGAVAMTAGVAKGSVQSAFCSRDALIAAVLDRWLKREQAHFLALLQGETGAAARTRAHVLSTAAETPASGAHMAGLLAALAAAGQDGSSGAGAWYALRAGGFAAATAEERRLRLALLAAEGAFFVRHLARVKLAPASWREIFADILAIVEGHDLPAPPLATAPSGGRPIARRRGA